ncbi:MAG: hypothetical protein EOM87_03340 [Clostridia bacterium]|nr:hypothetical protein [Clostridia bacterium]
MNKIRNKDLVRLLSYFVLFILLGFATIKGDIRPFYIGLFVGLVYCRQNLLLLAPLYICAMLLAEFSWQSLILASSPVVVLGSAYYIHFLFKKRVKIMHILIYSLISQLPLFFVYGSGYDIIVNSLIRIMISQIFTLSSIVVCYAVLVRGLRYRLTIDEGLAGGIVVLAVSLGLYCIEISNVHPYYFFLGFAILFAGYVFAEKGLILCLLMGIGGALYDINVALIAFTAIGGVIVYSLRKTNPFFMAAALLCLDVAFAAVTKYNGYNYINSILLASGAMVFALLPDKAKNTLLSLAGTDRGYATRTIVNRNRLELYTKLTGISSVLFEMQGTLVKDVKGMPPLAESKNFLAVELAKKYCATCSRISQCEATLGCATSSVIYDMVSRAIDKGKATIVDVPAFLTERCNKVKDFLHGSQEIAELYGAKKEMSDTIDNSKLIMSEQVSGIAGMLLELAKDVKKIVSFDSDREARIIDELAYKNVVASEAVVFSDGDIVNAIIVVREADEGKAIIGKLLSKVIGSPMIQSSRSTHSAGMVSISYVSAPKYDIIFGESGSLKEGSDKSGDTKSIVRIGTDKVLIAICDGMGSGKAANEGSNSAMSLVESFYKAGIDDTVVLSLINKLLSVRNEENFQTLDMCVFNLRKGYADFIKLGAPESVVRNKESIEIVGGGALPLGILDSVKPCVTRRHINSGDMIAMISDGVTDNIGAEGVARICEQNKTTNPQTLADLIVEDAEYIGKSDDKTVICCRLFYRI